MNKKIIFTIDQMLGGGAERVISILSNAFVERGFDTAIILTHQSLKSADLSGVNRNVQVLSVEDEVTAESKRIKALLMLKVRLVGKINRTVLKKDDDYYLIKKYEVYNYDKVRWLKKYFSQSENNTIISFLNDSIFLSLLSAPNNNTVIISERNDPERSIWSRTNLAFFKNMYEKANMMVFQSPDAMMWYKKNTKVRGRVIFNPVKPDLPQRFPGERRKKVVNFCRISSQKNLQLLAEAFELFSDEYPDYELYIYGDAVGNGAEGYVESLQKAVAALRCREKIFILPAQKDIHQLIADYAMFVSSSDFEGMSNSMLEAMAIGLPTICTDCPAGGARAVIKDHENGILVPVNDRYALSNAMKEVAANPELSERLSVNGTKIRRALSVNSIINQWMEIIE